MYKGLQILLAPWGSKEDRNYHNNNKDNKDTDFKEP